MFKNYKIFFNILRLCQVTIKPYCIIPLPWWGKIQSWLLTQPSTKAKQPTCCPSTSSKNAQLLRQLPLPPPHQKPLLLWWRNVQHSFFQWPQHQLSIPILTYRKGEFFKHNFAAACPQRSWVTSLYFFNIIFNHSQTKLSWPHSSAICGTYPALLATMQYGIRMQLYIYYLALSREARESGSSPRH